MKLPYRIVRPLARIALRTYFKKIYLSGVEHIPADKPIIFAANHPSAFLEPCLLATCLPFPLYFLVRGDFFEKKIYRVLLMSLQMIPIYRLKDIGLRGVKNNFSSLEYTYDLLKNKHRILVLAEGTTVHEKRLRPIQKGVARIAIGTVDKYPDLDVYIVPIGVNYTNILEYRSEVMLEIGKPISIQNFLKSTTQHPAIAIRKITQTLSSQLKELVVHIDKKEDEALTESLFELYRNNYPAPNFPVLSSSNKPLKREIDIAKRINALPTEDKENLLVKIRAYKEDLKHHTLPDAVIVQPHIYHPFGLIGIAFGLIPFLVGYLTNMPPIRLGKYIADKKVKEVAFYASVSASASLGFYLLYIFFLTIITFYLQSLLFLVFAIMIPFLGFFALQYYEYVQKWKAGRQFYKTEASIIDVLKQKRKAILRQFGRE